MNILDLGRIDYREALRAQQQVLSERIKKEIEDTLVVLEHEAVITLGRTSTPESIIDRDFFDKENIPVITTNRGGQITYHAPGQLVLYPIIDLAEKKRDISFYIDFLERTVTNSLQQLGVPAERVNDRRGIWASGKKIAFIGIAVKKWVTYHGVAVNINNDLNAFSKIDPCGEQDIKTTSVFQITDSKINMANAKKVFIDQFAKDLAETYDLCTAVTG